MNEKEMKNYAERMGLLPEDVQKLLWEAGRFLDRKNVTEDQVRDLIKKSEE